MCCTRPPHVPVATIFEISRYMYICNGRFSWVPGTIRKRFNKPAAAVRARMAQKCKDERRFGRLTVTGSGTVYSVDGQDHNGGSGLVAAVTGKSAIVGTGGGSSRKARKRSAANLNSSQSVRLTKSSNCSTPPSEFASTPGYQPTAYNDDDERNAHLSVCKKSEVQSEIPSFILVKSGFDFLTCNTINSRNGKNLSNLMMMSSGVDHSFEQSSSCLGAIVPVSSYMYRRITPFVRLLKTIRQSATGFALLEAHQIGVVPDFSSHLHST
ncbi:hypothetical protein CSKR_105884 [Clonorchis sinensis]|uniref:Uncharacterized protein n=1 Tax=Clonorchis sinensis TaxID=79923 RepID=A0A419QH93_CLOSI|nr:hypothetical protein CSKR_105884 [Clonorchis sinensis]